MKIMKGQRIQKEIKHILPEKGQMNFGNWKVEKKFRVGTKKLG